MRGRKRHYASDADRVRAWRLRQEVEHLTEKQRRLRLDWVTQIGTYNSCLLRLPNRLAAFEPEDADTLVVGFSLHALGAHAESLDRAAKALRRTADSLSETQRLLRVRGDELTSLRIS